VRATTAADSDTDVHGFKVGVWRNGRSLVANKEVVIGVLLADYWRPSFGRAFAMAGGSTAISFQRKAAEVGEYSKATA